MTREEATERFNGIINAMSISVAQSKFFPSKAELNELCDMAIEALSVANLKEEFESADAEFTDLPDIPRYYYEKVVGNMAHEINMLKEQLESADAVEVVRCKDCKFKRLYDDGDTKYYYCALEDRPNRNWSVDDTDYCSWGER